MDGDGRLIILATGVAQASVDGDRVRLSVESGEDDIYVSLSLHQATWLAVALADAINEALQPDPGGMSENVVPFRSPLCGNPK